MTEDMVEWDAAAEMEIAATGRANLQGYIRDAAGTALPGVTVTATNNGGTVTTNANGRYTLRVLQGWSGRVTPNSAVHSFRPSYRWYSNVRKSRYGEHYTGKRTAIQISGTVRDAAGHGIGGVAITATGKGSSAGKNASTATAADGRYSVLVPLSWSGTVAPTASGLSFTPEYTSYIGLATDQTAQDFAAGDANATPVADSLVVGCSADAPIEITLTGSHPAGLDLTFTIVSPPTNGTLGAIDNSAVDRATVVYTPKAGFNGSDAFTFRVHDGTSASDTATCTIAVSQRAVLNASYCSLPVTLDGVLNSSEWGNARICSMDASDKVAPGVVVVGSPAPNTSSACRIYTKHDAANVYVAVDVSDDVIVATASNSWEADCVELYLDNDNSATPNIGINRLQFSANAGGVVTSMPAVPAGSWSAAVRQRSGGYVVEYRLSKSALGLASAGSYGFDIAVTDIEPSAGIIASRYWHSAKVEAVGDESQWGILTLEAAGGALTVTPSGGLSSSGNVGGPFSPASASYTLTNSGGSAITWTAAKTQNWLSLSKTSGTLAAGATDTVTATVNTGANALAAGTYSDTIAFTNTTNGSGNCSRAVTLAVNAIAAGALTVSPAGGTSASGTQGGPFTPSSATYTVRNTGGASINWTASKTQNWVTLSKTSGTLAAGASDTVTATVNSNANTLGVGSYSDSLTFTNSTNGSGNTTRTFSLQVNAVAITGLTAAYATQPVTINGTLASGEWSDASSYTMDAVDTTSPGVVLSGVTTTTADTSAKVYLKHDASYVYIAVDVTDDAIVPTATNIHEADVVEIFLDADNSSTANIGYTQRLQFDIAAGGGTLQTPAVPANSWTGAAAQRTGGYSVEFRLSKSALGIVNPCGIDIHINDVEPTSASIQTSYWFFSRSGVPELDESQWGGLILQAATQPILAVNKTSLDFGASSTSQTFTVANGGAATLSYSITSSASWLTVSPASGTSTGEQDTITASINRGALAAGTNQASLTVNGGAAGTATIAVTAQNTPGSLSISGSTGLIASGLVGGAFSPTSITYTLSNTGGAAINWTAAKTQSWTNLSKASGTLAAGATDTVVVSINSSAGSLASGTFSDTVTFTNTTNGAGNGTRPVTLHVVPSLSISSSVSSGAAPLTVQFSATPSGATRPNGSTLQWNFGDGTPTATGATVTHTFNAAGTFVVSLTLLMPSGLPSYPEGTKSITTTGSSGTNANLATRSSGAAPLAVFFDAIRTTSPSPNWDPGVVQPGSSEDFASYHYTWDFGDSSGGTWPNSGKSKNTAVGHIAAHVYENPGTYTARLTIKTPSGATHQYQRTITVSAFSGTTYHVSTSGSDSNDGLSPSTPFATLSKGMSVMGANRRLLLRRGDTWTISSGFSASAAGPVMVGAYGSGNRPVISITNDNSIFSGGGDWRFVDLDLRRPNASTSSGSGVLSPKTNCLMLRCTFTGFSAAVAHYTSQASDTLGIVECTFTGQASYGIYIAPNGTAPPCTRVYIMGCSLSNNSTEHLIRLHTDKTLVAHNAFSRAPSVKHNIKLAAAPQDGGRSYHNWYSLVSDNRFTNPGSGWVLSMGPQDIYTHALVENLVVERNYFDVAGKTAIESRGANKVTIRNNVFKDAREAINIGQPVPSFSYWRDWRIYNNTYYSSRSEGFFLNLLNSPINWTVKNNIVHLPNTSGESYVVWSNVSLNLSQFTLDYNCWNIPNRSQWFCTGGLYTLSQWKALGKDANSISGDPGFVGASSGNFQLNSSSIAADKGTTLPNVRDDFSGASRPRGSGYDIGAYER